jgi:hypothetical protein
MIGKNGSRQWAALHPQLGDDRKRNCHGTPPETGEIVDDSNFFLVIMGTQCKNAPLVSFKS